MKQSEYIDHLTKVPEKQPDYVEKIQRAYQKYLDSNYDEDFGKLLKLLDTYCRPWMRRKLWNTGCYSYENEHTALQESHIAVWENITKDRANGDEKKMFAYFAFKLYQNKTRDIVRNGIRQKAKMDICSMEAPIGENGKTVGDTLMANDIKTTDEIRQMYDKLFRIYCKGFLNSKAYPPRILALYYARVLPHLKCAIPDTKATSAKWAFEKMGSRTMWELKEDSENELQKNVDAYLRWCEEFICQMNEEFDMGGTTCILKDIVYTEAYTKGKIEDWADSMHKTTVKAAMHLLSENKELLRQVKDYVSQGDVLYRFFQGGKSR